MSEGTIQTLTIDTDTFIPPTSWNELDLKTLLSCYHIIMQETGSLFAPTEIVPAKRMLLLQHLCNISDETFDAWHDDRVKEHGEEDGYYIFYEELSECLAFGDNLFDIEEDEEGVKKYQIKLGLTKCPWPKITYKGKGVKRKYFYAPANELANVTIYEMATLFSTFESYLQDQEADDLHRLIAILYRKPKPPTKANKRSHYQGDIRLPYLHHEATVQKRMEQVAKLEPLVKQAILFWFASCRQAIIDQFPNLFDAPKEEGRPDPFGWGGVLLALSNGLQNLDAISQQTYSNALVYLSYLEDQRKRQEKAMEKAKI